MPLDPVIQNEILKRRTFAIISHPDAGKTTMTEKLLLQGGVIREAGEVKAKQGKKSATSDWMALEQQKGISITTSVMQFDYSGLRVNLLDTPGHKDFSEDTYRTLVAVDCAMMLIDGAKGVEERTKKLYEVARYRHIPVFTFINKMDRESKPALGLIDEIENTLKMKCYPVNWPIGAGQLFHGIYQRDLKQMVWFDREGDKLNWETQSVDSITDSKISSRVPEDLLSTAKEELELMEISVDPFTQEKFLAGEVSPVFFGSAKQNFGVDLFLDFFTQHAPAAGPRKTRTGVIDPIKDDFSGFVFKIQANMDKKHRDRVAFIRICSGKFERGMKVHHPRLQRELRLAYSNQFLAQDRETVDVAYAGDIVGVNDSGNFQIGDSVSVLNNVQFEDIPKFTPELFAKLSVSDAMKRSKLQKAIWQLSQEGTVQVLIDPVIGQQDPIIGVVGELQFEVLLFRLNDEYGLDARLNRMPYTVARWPRKADGSPVTNPLKGNFFICRDVNENMVVLLEKEWDLNWAKKENPDVEFCTSISVARG